MGAKRGVLGRGTIPHLSPNNGEQSSFGPAHLCVQSRGAAPIYCALAYATQDVDCRATGAYIRVGVAIPAAYGHGTRQMSGKKAAHTSADLDETGGNHTKPGLEQERRRHSRRAAPACTAVIRVHRARKLGFARCAAGLAAQMSRVHSTVVRAWPGQKLSVCRRSPKRIRLKNSAGQASS